MLPWYIALLLILVGVILPFLFLRHSTQKEKERITYLEIECEQLRHHHRRIEQQMEQEQALMLHAVGVPYMLLRPSGRVVAANAEARKLFRLTEQLTANLLEHIENSSIAEQLGEIIENTKQLSDGDMQTHTLHLQFEGNQLTYRLFVTPLHNHHGEQFIGLVCRDISEEHRTMIIRRDFIANASHELRTPLTIIRGYLENLIDDPEMAEDKTMRQRALSLMKKHSDRITRLIENMLTISRLERADKGYLRMADFDLADTIHDVCQRLESYRRNLHNDIEVHITDEYTPFIMHGDRFYWEQVLFNLIENALKNNPEGHVLVKVSASLTEEGEARICIEDNGRGIKAESLPYIFNRFFRADSTGTIKGTGLGLSIVKNAVEAHHGSISVESEEGVFTRFSIIAPLNPFS